MDIFYIRKDLRKGRLGIKLFQYVEKELRRRGVDRWFVGTKLHADASSLFKYLKFEPVEIYYTKWIGE
jgi:N-acetylglutamate synthase-like GNAT family acetyltransferase